MPTPPDSTPPGTPPAGVPGTAVARAIGVPPHISGFRLVRYFTLASLAAFLLIVAPLVYLGWLGNDFFNRMLREQSLYFKQMQDGFAKQQNETARRDLLTIHEAGNINLTRLFANSLWEKEFAPLVDKAQRIPVAHCRAIANVIDAEGMPAQANEEKACYAGIGRSIMSFPEFGAVNAKVFDMMRKSTVFKIKTYDLRGITIYSSEYAQIGEDKVGNAGWQSAMAGKAASKLSRRDKFNAFEGVVENRDLMEIYIPATSAATGKIVGVFEIYSDVTPFLDQITNTSIELQQMNSANLGKVEQVVAVNKATADEYAHLLLAIVLSLLVLLWCALFLIVRYGQRIIDREEFERKQAERALREGMEKLRLFADNVPAMTVSFDENLRCLFANKRYADFFGFDTEAIVGKHLREIVGEDAYREIEGRFAHVLRGNSVAYQRARQLQNGELRHLEVKLLPHLGEQGKVLGCFAVTTDITEHKLTEERIQRVAHHDSLTGLPNRLLFSDRLNQAISHAKRDSRQFALLYLDLDRFKPVNDTLGHAAGDELLQAVAARIRQQVRESDTVARVGGDEFTVILPDIARREEAETVARKIVSALATPFPLGSPTQNIDIGASIGIATYPADAQNADALVNAADAAMYSAKQAGNRF